MSEKITKANITSLIGQYNKIRKYVKFKVGYEHDVVFDTTAKQPKKIPIEVLKLCVNELEGKFSGNCNCLVNNDCCQGCQRCQSQSCQTCQGCQTCQRCQSQCNCNCNCCGDE